MSPASGTAGQKLIVSGTGFYSANGKITAALGGQTAPTACPSETSCTVTVPNLGHTPTRVTLTITTTSGTSNGAAFTYR